MPAATPTANLEQMKIVIVGHVDHGKSTFVGRLFYDTGSLPTGKYEQLVRIAERRGVPFEWANLMDSLQSERDDLTAEMNELNESIDKLEKEIGTTKRKLETAEGDRNFLLGELSRLQTERETLVRQFNDLAALRTQVAKLKEEAAIKRRLEWKRAGVYALQEQKGAERLTAKPWVMAKADNDLNADIYQDNRPLSPKATKDVLDGSTSVQPAENP